MTNRDHDIHLTVIQNYVDEKVVKHHDATLYPGLKIHQ
jgi:hypothetical protein